MGEDIGGLPESRRASTLPVARSFPLSGPVTPAAAGLLPQCPNFVLVHTSCVARRALSFGAAASAYERFRPGYPDEVADLVFAYAGRPVTTALEIGAGTGKATRMFARPGVTVTATDPDAAMLTELRRHVPTGVTTVLSAFEDLQVDRT